MLDVTPGGRKKCKPPRDEIDVELQAHLEERQESLRGEGLSEAEAREEALMRFGSLERIRMELERMHDRYRGADLSVKLFTTVAREVQLVIRQLRRNWVPSLGVITILTLGISASILVYSMVDNVLVEQLPYPGADRLVSVRSMDSASTSGSPGSLSPPTYRIWRSANANIEGITAVGEQSLEMQTENGPSFLNAAAVSNSFFRMLGAQFLVGRPFSEEEDAVNADPVIVLSESVWRSRFGADPGIVGSTIMLTGEPTTVVGVLARGSIYPADTDAWVPLEPILPENRPGLWGAKYLTVIAKLQPGSTMPMAAAEFRSLMPEGDWEQHIYPELRSLKSALTDHYQRPLRTLLISVLLVLLVACANVGSILLARGISRQREAAIRIAVGASKLRVAGSQILEALVLGTVSCIASLILVSATLRSVLAWAPDALPRAEAIDIDVRVVIAAFVTAVITGLLTALIPVARTLTSSDILAPLRDGGRTATASKQTRRILGSLVAGELAVTLVLLTSAALLGKSFYKAVTQDDGFNPENVLAINISLPNQRYSSMDAMRQFQAQLLDRLQSVPGVTSVGLGTSNLPATGHNMRSPLATRERPEGNPDASVHVVGATPGYAETLGIELISGRFFERGDVASPRPVVMLSESAARTYFPNEDPLGKEIHSFFTRDFAEVVGVVGDVRINTLSEPPPAIYNLLGNMSTSSYSVVVKASLPPDVMFESLRQAIWDVDPQLPADHLQTLNSILRQSVAQPRFYLMLLGAFAATTLTLALIGFYAVVTLIVQSRKAEIGVRLALGATRSSLARLLISRSAALAVVGAVVGIGISLGAGRFLESVLYNVDPIDPLVMGASATCLVLIALLATLVPVRRAVNLDPVAVLREE